MIIPGILKRLKIPLNNSYRLETEDGFVLEPNHTIKTAGIKEGIQILLVKSPLIFICCASDDLDIAEKIYKKLAEASLKPWLASKDLKPGDSEKEVIESVIKDECDFFIIINSTALAKIVKDHVHNEINIAVEKQKSYQKGIHFIIPISMNRCRPLSIIKDKWQAEYSKKGEIKKVIEVINQDYQKMSKNKE